MTKRTRKSEPGAASQGGYSWRPSTFMGEEVEKNLTYAQWRYDVGAERKMILLGFEKRESKEFEENEFTIYFGQDADTGEQFSFIPGKLFDYLVVQYNIVNGDRLGVRYRGGQKLASGYQAKQWDVVKLKAAPPPHPDAAKVE